jgi:hypothetical protein
MLALISRSGAGRHKKFAEACSHLIAFRVLCENLFQNFTFYAPGDTFVSLFAQSRQAEFVEVRWPFSRLFCGFYGKLFRKQKS